MQLALIAYLRDPYSKTALKPEVFLAEGNNVLEGVLVNAGTQDAYCIHKGVAIMIKNGFSQAFLDQYSKELGAIEHQYGKLNTGIHKEDYYNFGEQWKQHQEKNLQKTWGWYGDERLQMFYLETQTDQFTLKGKTILDAGCGNGILTYHIAKNNAASVFGVDYSFTLLHSATVMDLDNLGWVIADIGSLPFIEEVFDLVISNGVLHHTRNTKESFNRITPFVKKGGKFYIWLYRRPIKVILNLYLYFLEFIRLIASFMPGKSKLIIVHLYASWIYLLKTILGKMKSEGYQDIFINAHDFITPRYRHCHNTIEVSLWYFENGFSPVTITHWDNPHGFGVLAEKNKMENTPGINFTRKDIKRRVD